MVEQSAHNAQVIGSNPIGTTRKPIQRSAVLEMVCDPQHGVRHGLPVYSEDRWGGTAEGLPTEY